MPRAGGRPHPPQVPATTEQEAYATAPAIGNALLTTRTMSAASPADASAVRFHASTVRSAGSPGSFVLTGRTTTAKIAAKTATTATVIDTTRSIGERGRGRPNRMACSDAYQCWYAIAAITAPTAMSGKPEEPTSTREPERREHLGDGEAAGDERQRGADPREERPLVGEREAGIGFGTFVDDLVIVDAGHRRDGKVVAL